MALEWVHNNAYVKGKPKDFCSWVNLNLLPQVLENHASAPSKITARTARRWLHKLGFEKISSKKGIYIDGHERADVVEYRKVYLISWLVYILTSHHLFAVMSLLPMHPCLQVVMSHLRVGILCLSFMMKAYFILMMTKGGCGVKKIR